MNFIQRARAWAADKIKPAESDGRKTFLAAGFIEGLPLQKFNDYETYLQASCSKVWAHWKAADIVSEQLRSVPRVTKRRGVNVEAPPELAALLKVANPEMTFDELVYLTGMHIKITGNAFWFKSTGETVRRGGKRPNALYPMNPARVEIIPKADGGTDDITNLAPICRSCHATKSAHEGRASRR